MRDLSRNSGKPLGTVAFCQSNSFLYCSVVLFDYVVEISALAQNNPARKHTIYFQRIHRSRIGRVVVDIHHPWDCIARCLNRIAQKAFGRGFIAFRCQQKVDRLPRGIGSAKHIFVAALYLYIGLADTVTLVGRLSDVVGSVCSARVHTPAPAPNATGIHL
jgi:hypothetical protein